MKGKWTRELAGYSPRSHKGLDMIQQLIHKHVAPIPALGHTTAVSSSSSELAKGDCGVCRQCGGCDSWDPQGWMHVTACDTGQSQQ